MALARTAAPGVASLLDALDPEQRAAATLPDGPAQVIAPAGSGKTTTLIAHLGVLLGRGVPAERIAVVTFNREAAGELGARIAARLGPILPGASAIEVRTLHALARQVLLDAVGPVQLVADRLPLLRAARRRVLAGRADDGSVPDAATLDTRLSAWKVEGRAPPAEAREALETFDALLEARGAIDFDDLVARAVALLERDDAVRVRWQARFSHLCVDEFQDVDAAQLRLVRILAAPENNLFVVGDDDQTIYAWRLADVRRILGFGAAYPGARRVQLATNYRCPPPVVEASRRLIEANRERFEKRIEPSPRRSGESSSVVMLATVEPDWPDRMAVLAAQEGASGGCCILARTRAELTPIALALLRAGQRHASTLATPLESETVRWLVDAARRLPGGGAPFPALLGLRAERRWRRADGDDALGDDDHAAIDALLGWAAGFARLDRFVAASDEMLARITALRDPSAPIELVTVHGAKGREWPTVIVIGFEEERFPNRRSLLGAADPGRALEEERRLAYVALTRATRRLVLAFDPARPSRFLEEMGYRPTWGATAAR
ncbi:MAG TPA: ATP-dependent helicase [Candidatus Limnocylindria bacterium]|nr:ATP-dependent helicase [Candidatus Limnocylindria bacterium]